MPKLIFRHSWIYDKFLQRDSVFKVPKERLFNSFIQKISQEWEKYGNKILKELGKTTKLRFKSKEIVVYVSFGVFPFSDPLTLNLKSNIHTLTHELIHRILLENKDIVDKNWNRLINKYKKETQRTKVHIIVHSIHEILLKKIFGERIFKKERQKVKDKIDYIKAWKIVDSEGAKNIVNQLIGD